MTHYLKYYAYKYLNTNHSTIEKVLFKCFCELVVLVFRAPRSLLLSIKSEIESDDFKIVIRRLFWLLRGRGFRRLVIEDRYFDISIGLPYSASIDLYEFCSQRYSWNSEFNKHVSLAQLASGVMESQVSAGDKTESTLLLHNEFDALFLKHFEMASQKLDEAMGSRSESVRALEGERDDKRLGKSVKVNLMRRHALEILSEVLALSEECEVPMFAIGGTLLGLIREKNFIAHDYDIDLGLFAQDYSFDFIDRLERLDGFRPLKYDFPCYRTEVDGKVFYEKKEQPTLLKLFHNSGVQLDIFVHFVENGKCWHGSSLHRWENDLFELEHREFLGLSVLTPADYDKYLTDHYGDWRTPVSDFNCSTGTPNVVLSDSCKTRCYFLKREFYDPSNFRQVA